MYVSASMQGLNMDKVLQLIDERIKKAYRPGWNTSSTCSYALRYASDNTGDDVIYKDPDICHARAYPNLYNKPIRSVTTSIWRYNEHSAPYYEWILSKEHSPWRKLFHDMTIHRDDTKIYAVTIDNLHKHDHQAAYVMNFLIATRIPSEVEDTFEGWVAAVKAGFSMAEGLLITNHFIIKSANHITPRAFNHGHFPLDATAQYDHYYYNNGNRMKDCINSVVRMENADPVKVGGMWKNNAKPTPINGVWRDGILKPKLLIYNVKPKDANGRKVIPVYEGRFKLNERHIQAFGLADGLVLKQNAKEVVLTMDDLMATRMEWRA